MGCLLLKSTGSLLKGKAEQVPGTWKLSVEPEVLLAAHTEEARKTELRKLS